ncbi:MAG: RlmE family RNA methyltransferase [Pseudomonadota bacterium]
MAVRKKQSGSQKSNQASTRKKGNANPWEDHLSRRAKAENYPARSVYKLEEIQKKFNILKPLDQVLDLGCAPGSWLLYAARQVGVQGKVWGIDLKQVEIQLPENVMAIQDNIMQLENQAFLSEHAGLDVVLSDMAPATTGRKDVDAMRSFDLCNMALTTAERFLAPNGHFVCKIFQGNEFAAFQKTVTTKFKECKIFKPESCRKQSKEIYIIAKYKK